MGGTIPKPEACTLTVTHLIHGKAIVGRRTEREPVPIRVYKTGEQVLARLIFVGQRGPFAWLEAKSVQRRCRLLRPSDDGA